MVRLDFALAVPSRETPVRYGGLMRELLGFHLLLLQEREAVEAAAGTATNAAAGTAINAAALRPLPMATMAATATSAATGQPPPGTAANATMEGPPPGVAMGAAIGAAAQADPPPDAQVGRVLDRLESALTLRWEAARHTMSDREIGDLRTTQYLMCALADDLFLYEADWNGAAAWSADVLEQRVFGTRIAGERVFDTAADLVRRRDPAAADLAAVHLAVLGMGFKGRYRGRDNATRLEAHARALFELLAGRSAGPAFGTHNLVPRAIANVVIGQRTQRLWRLTIGLGAVLSILGAFVVLSTLLWFAMTDELAAAANAVLRAAE